MKKFSEIVKFLFLLALKILGLFFTVFVKILGRQFKNRHAGSDYFKPDGGTLEPGKYDKYDQKY